MTLMKKENLKRIMKMAWRIFRVTGEQFSDCLKRAWLNFKLNAAMKTRTVKFYFQKVDGSLRQAFGTLRDDVVSNLIKGNDRRAKSEDLFTYYDTEKNEFRCFKRFNLVSVEW